MRRILVAAIGALPIVAFTCLPKPAAAETVLRQRLPNPVVIADRDDYNDRWNNGNQNNGNQNRDWQNRDSQNRDWQKRDSQNRDWRDRNSVRHDYDDRMDSRRRDDSNSRYDSRYDNRRDYHRQIWIPGHWESGFLGIGRKWVAGHYETR